MCGIAGYCGAGNEILLTKMLDSIRHRGYDDRGTKILDNVGVGHNRLSIIDLSTAGRQPMTNEDSTVFIVFNGEIYNYREIRELLIGRHVFRSGTDTEVIIHAYEEYGVGCLKLFNGMFSFVIYDLKRNLLFGARDRLGKKPLKYYIDGGIFAFASEIKALLFCLKGSPEIDSKAINDYLTLQYIPAPNTGFKNIFKLPPAHYFTYQGGKLEVNRYWALTLGDKLKLPDEEWERLILENLEKAVARRMISDVPLGAFLSGGIDSSAVVAFMSRNSGQRIKTFTVGFDDPRFDETRYAKMVTTKYNTDHTVLAVDSSALIENIPRLIQFYDEPIADNSILPTFLLCQLTKRHITVALNGDGGDENFAGYDRYNIVYFSRFYRYVPKIIRRILVDHLANLVFEVKADKMTERIKRFSNTFELPFYQKYVHYNCFFTNDEKSGLYSRDFRQRTERSDTFNIFRNCYNSHICDLDNALSIDINNYLAEDLLYKVDCASMAHALELRSPFLDHEFMELIARMPADLKIRNFSKKYFLKKILVKNAILPGELVYRKKKGFNLPLNTWFKGPLREFVKERILSCGMKESGIFEYPRLEKYVADYFISDLNYDNNMFALLFLSMWLDEYL